LFYGSDWHRGQCTQSFHFNSCIYWNFYLVISNLSGFSVSLSVLGKESPLVNLSFVFLFDDVLGTKNAFSC